MGIVFMQNFCREQFFMIVRLHVLALVLQNASADVISREEWRYRDQKESEL